MGEVCNIFSATRTLTFDCYGTLVDWEAGLKSALGELFGEAALDGRATEVFDAYVEAEAAVEGGSYRPYRVVLAEAARRVARMFDIEPATDPDPFMADHLRGWRPFPDTNEALKRLASRFRLGILSNIDRELLEATMRHFDVTFDLTVTAEDVRAYKPSHLHFLRFIHAHGGREGGLHVAQSLFHDGVPAAQLDLPFVWINRRGQAPPTRVDGPRPIAIYADLASFADEICGE
jgi:2-haloalkanoic acid dehalogenase type II